MGAIKDADLINRVEVILEDSTNVIFTTTAISSQMQDSLSEVSEFSPQKVKHIIPVTNNSKLIDISGITGLIGVDYVEYTVDQEPEQRRSHSIWGDSLKLDITTAPSASSKGTLTGTFTFTTDSTAITGSSTLFTTELEVGFYIQKSGSSTWYRIASISSDTALVLSANVKSADNGADTEDATKYWYEYAYLFCRKVHYLTVLTDLLGAIDLTAGYAAGAVLIHVDLLGTGTIPQNAILTIAGVPGSYRVIEDAVIGSNETNIKISPGLEGRVANAAVVTIRSSSLTSDLERLLPELVAARVVLNWVGDTRTALDNTRTILNTANTELDKVGARLTSAASHISSGAGEITDQRSAATTELGLIPARIIKATDDLTSAASLIDTVPVGDNPVGEYIGSAASYLRAAALGVTASNGYLNTHSTGTAYGNLAARELQIANGYISEGQGYISEAMARLRTANLQLTTTQTWARYKLETTLIALRRLPKPRQKSYGYSRS